MHLQIGYYVLKCSGLSQRGAVSTQDRPWRISAESFLLLFLISTAFQSMDSHPSCMKIYMCNIWVEYLHMWYLRLGFYTDGPKTMWWWSWSQSWASQSEGQILHVSSNPALWWKLNLLQTSTSINSNWRSLKLNWACMYHSVLITSHNIWKMEGKQCSRKCQHSWLVWQNQVLWTIILNTMPRIKMYI